MTDPATEVPVPSVRDRLLAALISPARIDDHHAAGRLSVDGEIRAASRRGERARQTPPPRISWRS